MIYIIFVEFMRLQSAIEFLSTYGFVFIILTALLAVILFIALSGRSVIQSQCAGFTGFTCGFVGVYSNSTDYYTLVTLSLTNSQGVPVNITAGSITEGTITANAFCTPNFVYPGGETTCAAEFSGTSGIGQLLRGYYSVNANYCNNGIHEIPQGNCTSASVYSGSFLAQVTDRESEVFSVIAGVSANTVSLTPYGSISVPLVPQNYTIIQNGDWIASGYGGSTAYSFGTPGYVGRVFVGVNTMAFPQTVSQLNEIPSSIQPYNSLFSMAFTTLYVYSTQASEKIGVDDAMAVYYKPVASKTWNSLFGGTAWNGIVNTNGNIYSANVQLTPGMYNLAVVWSNVNFNGLQALNVS